MNKHEFYEVDYTIFGGIIYPSDFCTDHRGRSNPNGSQIARRIAGDAKLDRQWRQNREERFHKKHIPRQEYEQKHLEHGNQSFELKGEMQND